MQAEQILACIQIAMRAIKNLKLKGVDITGYYDSGATGGIAGVCYCGSILNCFVSGKISANHDPRFASGGLEYGKRSAADGKLPPKIPRH